VLLERQRIGSDVKKRKIELTESRSRVLSFFVREDTMICVEVKHLLSDP
jgi:Fe2+ or Zn2+ uptake regulation protein